MADESPTERLLRLLAAHQQDLLRYVFALLPHEEDAKDVLQETYVALTRKFSDYDEARPFLPWAYGFAYMEVLKFRERSDRARNVFCDDVLAALAAQRLEESASQVDRLQALDHCLEKLSDADRRLIAHRYLARTTSEQLAEIVGSSRRTMFRNLDRVRRMLHECISRRMEEMST